MARMRDVRRRPVYRVAIETLEDRRLLSFAAATSYPLGSTAQAMAVGDVNGDGRPDLVTVSNGAINVLRGNANGTFQPAQQYAAGTYVRSIAVADVNGDGRADVMISDGATVSVLLGKADGTLLAAAPLTLPGVVPAGYDGTSPLPQSPGSVVLSDINADGKLDLVVGARTFVPTYVAGYGEWSWGYYTYYEAHYEDQEDAYVNVLLGSGDATFGSAVATEIGNVLPPAISTADFNGDNKLDVVMAGDDIESTVLLGNGTGTLQAPLRAGSGYASGTVPIADFNGDGKLDLFLGLDTLTGLGDGTFQYGQAIDGPYGVATGVGDVNGDGKADLIATSQTSALVRLGYGDGTFALATASPLTGYGYFTSMALADFNGDGRLDLATAENYTGSIFVALNGGSSAAPSTLGISDATITEGNAGTAVMTFTVTRAQALSTSATVSYATASGTAIAGRDFQTASGQLTFAAGETTKTISVLINGDVTDEYDETFSVNLSAPTNADIIDGQGIGTILDNDAPPKMSIGNVSKREGRSGRTSFDFMVTLSAPSEKDIWVSYATANGSATAADNDYVGASGSVYFAAGQTSRIITVMVVGDLKRETDETFFVDLSGATNASILGARGVGTILDDDAPTGGGGKK